MSYIRKDRPEKVDRITKTSVGTTPYIVIEQGKLIAYLKIT